MNTKDVTSQLVAQHPDCTTCGLQADTRVESTMLAFPVEIYNGIYNARLSSIL